jgi:PAS domain S-box-containing protein
MEEYENAINKIKMLLKDDIRGMTITDIAKTLDMSRTSVGKYLDILLVSGYVEVKKFGSAKVYFLSDRIPLSTMLNFTSDQIVILDRNFSILQVNQSFLDAWKFEREDLIGKHLNQFNLSFLSTKEFQSNIQSALDGKEGKTEINFVFEEKIFYLEIKFVPTIFETGYPGITMLIEDNTEKKQGELLLKESEEQFRRQFENNLIPAYLWKKIEGEDDFLLTDYNKTGFTITYGNVEKFLHKKASEMYGREHEIFQDMKKCYKTESSFHREMKYAFREVKETKIFNVQYSYVSNKQIVIYTEDISERKKAEKLLRESEEKFRTISETNPIGMIITTLDGKMIYFNQRFMEITGYSEEEIKKSRAVDYYANANDRSSIMKEIEKSVKVHTYNRVLKRKDGKLYDVVLNIKRSVLLGEEVNVSTITEIAEKME